MGSQSLPVFSAMPLALVALLAGTLVPFQAISNGLLGRALGHPLWATLASLLVSILAVLPVIALMRVPPPLIQQSWGLPLWTWGGGLAGVVYITSALFITPRLGATTFIVCVIAGQMLVSLLIDHFGLMGMPVRPANTGRVSGIVLIFIGMLMIQWFTPTEKPPSATGAAPPIGNMPPRQEST